VGDFCITWYNIGGWTSRVKTLNVPLGKELMKEAIPVAVGRPRAFDLDHALEQALQVFWRKGYEGASLPDLTQAMGINRPSLYAAFGNKEALFRKALDRYVEGTGSYMRAALDESTARAAVERLLHVTADRLADPRHPGGCLIVQGALACGDAADSIRSELVARRAAAERLLQRRLERARVEGDLPADAHPADLAKFIVTVIHGMAVQASSGVTRAKLRRVADLALRAWPNSKKK
jgi:AcrR family transcriptional regulator